MQRALPSFVAAAVILGTCLILLLTLGAFTVVGPSMEPSLSDGEFIVTEKATYLFGQPRRGDVIVFCDHRDRSYIYIKRLVGLPGDTVKVMEGALAINERPVPEPYLENAFLAEFPARKLEANEYFALGDHRMLSKDSRNFGPIARSDIIGRVWIVCRPPLHLSWAPHFPR